MKERTEEYFNFLVDSPTAHHATTALAQSLAAAGFSPFPGDYRELEPGKGYLLRRGTGFLAAIRTGTEPIGEAGARITLAHSDSPALQLKVRGLSDSGTLRTAPVEVYGAPILTSWLDTPLEIAGTIATRGERGVELHPVRSGDPVGIIPNLAIHLNRKVNEGQSVDKHTQLRPLLDEAFVAEGVEERLCALAGVDPKRLLEAELYLVPAAAPAPWGIGADGFYTSPRIDNLAGVYADIFGLLEAGPGAATQIGVVFDHEEIGSLSRTGARAPVITELLTEIAGGDGSTLRAVRSKSLLLSNDATHGDHPNYPEKHDPSYLPVLGHGPAVKRSAVRRYATEPEATAMLRLIAEEAGIELQEIQNRADVPAGTTVGAMSAASTMLPAVDIGLPILAMHSTRESGHIGDLAGMITLLRRFYRSELPRSEVVIR